MLKCISASVRSLVIVGIFFIIGCQKSKDHVLATIDGKEAITVNDFNIFLEKKFEQDASNLTFSEKREYLDLIINDRLKWAYGIEKGYDQDIALDMESARHSILLNKARDQYILNHFITDANVEEYQKSLGMTINSQNLIVRFNDRRESPATLSKEEAKRKADSIYAVISPRNYDAMAEKFSDFKNPATQKGNTVLDKLIIGQVPYTYEKAVLSMKPNGISSPVEVPGAFVIIHLVSKDTSTIRNLEKAEIAKFMKSKFDDMDQFMIRPFHITLLDSLYLSAKTEISEENILMLAARLKDCVNVRASVNQFTEDELGRSLARFEGGGVTVKRFLENYAAGVFVKFTPDLITQAVEYFCKTLLVEQLVIDGGYLETEEFKSAILFARQNMIVKKINDALLPGSLEPTEAELHTFFSRNRYRYRTNGAIVVSEITSPDISEIHKTQKNISSGVDFEKAVESKDKPTAIKFNPKVSFNFRTRNELAARALKMDKNEVSDIFIRKDSSFSIIKIINRSEPQLLSFNSVRKKIENDYLAVAKMNREIALLAELKKRWKVVIYENNLQAF